MIQPASEIYFVLFLVAMCLIVSAPLLTKPTSSPRPHSKEGCARLIPETLDGAAFVQHLRRHLGPKTEQTLEVTEDPLGQWTVSLQIPAQALPDLLSVYVE